MKLLWWKKHGDCDYELGVQWRSLLFKKYQGKVRGNCNVWRWWPGCTRADTRDACQLTKIWKAIEWGTHDDKERKDND